MTTIKKIKTDCTSVHNVEACVLFCQDPRFLEGRINYLAEVHGIKYGDFDPLSVPGSGKCILDNEGRIILFGIEVAVGLHSGEKVFVFHHMDCGAYGGSSAIGKKYVDTGTHNSEEDFQKTELRKVRDNIVFHLSRTERSSPEIILVLEHLYDGEIGYEIIE